MTGNRRLTITTKFIIYLLFTTVIPLVVISYTSYAVSKSVMQRRVSSYAMELTNKQKDYMELMLEEVGSLIANVSSVDEIKDALAGQQLIEDDYVKLATQAKIGYILSGYLNLRGLVSIDIFAQNGTHYHVGDTLNVKEIRGDVRDRIYNEAIASDHGVTWSGVEDNVNARSTNAKVITAAKVMKVFDPQTMREVPIGLLLVNYSVDSFYEHFQQSYLGEDSYLMIVDNQNRIVFHPDRALAGEPANLTRPSGVGGESGSYTEMVNGKEMYVTFLHSSLSDWTIYSFVPVSTLTIDTSTIRDSTLLILLACALLIAMFALNLSKTVVEPIRRVTDQFKKMQEGETEVTKLEEKRSDEIGDLIAGFNIYLDSMEEKRSVLEALRESREQYRSVVDNMREGVFQTDLNGRIVFLNPAWTEITGYSVESSLGCDIFEYLPPEEQQPARELSRQMMRREIPFLRQRIRVITTRGDMRIVEFFSCLTMDAAGSATGAMGTMNDVTEQDQFLNRLQEAKEAAEAAFLEKSEELRTEHQQLLDIIEFLPDATFVVNRERQVIAWNRAIEEMTGILKEQVLGKGDYIYAFPFYGRQSPVLIDYIFSKEILPDDPYQFIEQRGNTVYAVAFAPLLNRGQGAYLNVTASLLIDGSGSIVGAVQSIRDITEQTKAREALAEEKERLAVTLRSIGEGVITTDTRGRVLLLNKAAEEITGWGQAAAVGQELYEIFKLESREDRSDLFNKLERRLDESSQTPPSGHKVLTASDGTRKIITDNISRIMDHNDKLLGYVLVFRDITESHKLEAQLALSQKMESIGQLAAGIAHEINTPLQYVGDNTRFLQDSFRDLSSVIKGYRTHFSGTDAGAEENSLPEAGKTGEDEIDVNFLIQEIPEAIAQSLEGLSRVSQIVLAMKDFSHPGKKDKMYSDLNRAIEGTVVISRNEWKYVADLETILDPSLPMVNCVVDEINQVVLNMIINSTHAIAEKGEDSSGQRGKITVKTSFDEESVQIAISDTGAGIPKSMINKIFDPFFTTKEVGKGTGQGLALAHNIIINKHKGKIQVDSEVNVGTRFVLTIPIHG